jgi:hypothetical protein
MADRLYHDAAVRTTDHSWRLLEVRFRKGVRPLFGGDDCAGRDARRPTVARRRAE